jgi:hypothetical protein
MKKSDVLVGNGWQLLSSALEAVPSDRPEDGRNEKLKK